MLGQLFPFGGCFESVVLGKALDCLRKVRRLTFAPRRNRTVTNRQVLIGHDQAFVKEQLNPQPVTFGTGPERRVERKQARFDFRDREARHGTGKVFRECDPLGITFFRGGFQNGDAIGQIQRCAE